MLFTMQGVLNTVPRSISNTAQQSKSYPKSRLFILY